MGVNGGARGEFTPEAFKVALLGGGNKLHRLVPFGEHARRFLKIIRRQNKTVQLLRC